MSSCNTPLPDSSLEHFSSVVADKKPRFLLNSEQKSLLVRACQRIFSEIEIKVDLNVENKISVARIAKFAKCQYRHVTLSGSWWEKDNGVLLAFHEKTQRPCALLPKKYGGYYLFDPGDGRYIDLTSVVANCLSVDAYLFYRPLPESPIKLSQLLKFALSPQKSEIFRIIYFQLFVGLLGLLVPIVTGYLFETVVPNAEIALLWQFAIGLSMALFSMTAFNMMQMLALIRLKFKVTFSVQSAIWNRLLKLPVSFFRRFTAGDLADRSGGIDAIQARLTGIILKSLLSGIFSVLTLILMLYYSRPLTFVALGLLFITSVIIIVVNIIQLGYQRRHYEINGRIKGFMLQILTAISKLRITRREENAYQQWAIKFSKKMHILYQSGRLHYYLNLFQVFFTVMNLIIVFYVVVSQGDKISFGQFIAFNAAYGQFLASFFSLTGIVTELIGIIPLYERVKPVLKEEPETTGLSDISINFQGKVDIQKISFSYSNEEDAPLVLKNISMTVNPGQFIAIVGLSGSGKSTLLRLLMGFEKPINGNIFYDSYDLSFLNPVSLRESLGVVLQSQTLLPGTILENIADRAELTEEDAWKFARIAAIDEDIANMPMKMQTQMMQSGSTLSMGQRQRIALARALVHQPKLLLLDEATSALDNQTQKRIYDNLLNLHMTKIVTAHRLSTIVAADRIYVFDKGEIIQQGSYQQLVSAPGIFAELVKRQLC